MKFTAFQVMLCEMVNNLTFHATHIYSIYPKILFFCTIQMVTGKKVRMHANNNNVLCCLFMNCNMTTERLFAECRNFGWGSDFVLISLSHTGSIQNKQKHINFLFGWSVSNDIAKRENQK